MGMSALRHGGAFPLQGPPGEIQQKTVVPPTTRHAGEGERVYECLFCHHQQRSRYRIPKKDDGAATAAILGAAVGSALGSRRGGGGGFGGEGFGGGFGGGSTGGGGASGGW